MLITLEQYVDILLEEQGKLLLGLPLFTVYAITTSTIESDTLNIYNFDPSWDNAKIIKKMIDEHFGEDS